jgi:hypothetical protein
MHFSLLKEIDLFCLCRYKGRDRGIEGVRTKYRLIFGQVRNGKRKAPKGKYVKLEIFL